MVVLELPKDEKTDELLESLMDHFNELKEEASEIRKEGYDTTMADVLMIDVVPRVKYAKVTYEEKDVNIVKKLLAQIRHELDVIKSGTEFDDALKKIQDAYDNIRHDKCADAKDIYMQLREIYPKLPEDQRRIVYKASLDIHNRIVRHSNTGNTQTGDTQTSS